MNIYSLLNQKHGEPAIVSLPETIQMIGVSMHTNMKTIYRDAQTLGKRYDQIKKAGKIPNKQEPWGFVAISKDFQDDGSWEYLMGDVVTTLETVPDGMIGFTIPTKTYARFSLQPRWFFLWGIALGMLKKYIYTEWLPNSGYEIDGIPVGDFEYHDERAVSKKPEIDLYVSVRKKSQRD